MKFCWATITVKSMEESLKFYQGIVGLKIDRRIKVEPDIDIVFLGDGETKVELIYSGREREPVNFDRISLGFEVESLDETMKMLQEKGVKNISGPFHPGPGVKFCYVDDPDGFKIQFLENI